MHTELPTNPPEFQTIVNAVANTRAPPITAAEIIAILKGEGGRAPHVKTLFSDVTLAGLERAGASVGIDRATILEAYRVAKDTVAAANPTLDEALEVTW